MSAQRALVFTGFMGAGKSTAARTVDPGALDTDALFESEHGPIADCFARHGEAAFREREEAIVLGALEHDGVVALGGGALGSARVREALRDHTVVWLEVTEEEAWARAAGHDRPLTRDRAAFAGLHAQREAAYEAAADAILPPVDRDVVLRALPALRALRPGERLLWAHTASGEYPVWMGEEAWPAIAEGDVVVSDEVVGELFAERFARSPTAAPVGASAPDAPAAPRRAPALPTAPILFPPGEAHKTLATAQRVWEAMVAAGLTRAGRVVAVGGGVVGDLAGFCAATYQRGVPVVHIPTTLVAQVDSAYGGKTGVDLRHAKNYVGAYHQPAAVHVVPSTLETLPAAERAAGYAEVVKTALIAGGALWARVERGDPVDGAMVLACARTKLTVVRADERDGGRRQVLNLGHTVAHALETATGYAMLRHGEAVALGLLAALRLSGQEALRARVRELLRETGLPVALPAGVDPDGVVALTRRDKKRTGARTPFVLVAQPGDVRHGHDVADDELRAAVAELTP
ncbi:MAG: bifunctional shikimate kinase/3-dehydroquinate synthase [Solirubrobacteraceae bacterium MAG38_C4-C5]|nr:bifunctional shikimate kinase/3-dehydroquinate synthase [Candidatus Siliceabacter maunaloa]